MKCYVIMESCDGTDVIEGKAFLDCAAAQQYVYDQNEKPINIGYPRWICTVELEVGELKAGRTAVLKLALQPQEK